MIHDLDPEHIFASGIQWKDPNFMDEDPDHMTRKVTAHRLFILWSILALNYQTILRIVSCLWNMGDQYKHGACAL